jgi:hypothetical protein
MLLVIVRKKIFIWTGVTYERLERGRQKFESADLIALDYCLWGWRAKFTREVGYRRRTAGSHLDVAACIKTREDQLRRTTRDLRTRVAKCFEVDGGIFENLLWVATNLSFKSSIRMNIQLIAIKVSVLPFTALLSVYIQTALTMNDTTTSQNSDPAFWTTLCRILVDRKNISS